MLYRHIFENIVILAAAVFLIYTDHGWWALPLLLFMNIPKPRDKNDDCNCGKDKTP